LFGVLPLFYQVERGEYARFWKDKSPVFIGVLWVMGWCGGLTDARVKENADSRRE
jgi:hypothetical protein